ncbi:MAG: HIT family protein [Polyangiaceae bacterium]|nr:HIT family protein [Polyangiaceae bacterium]
MAETLFARIVRGELPAHKVYEDDLVLAFLDIAPLARGHVLVIPKEPAETLDQLSDEASAAIGRVLPRICRALKQVTGCADFNVLQNNGAPAHQAVFHVHFHVIPKPTPDTGLGIGWPAQRLDPSEAPELAATLAAAVRAAARRGA